METEKVTEKISKNKFNIVNIIAGINVILLIGLALLYVLYFTDFKRDSASGKNDQQEKTGEDIISEGINIAHIDYDRLLEEYYLTAQLRREMRAKRAKMETELMKKQQKFREDLDYFQRGVQSGIISQSNAAVLEQELMIAQQEILDMDQSFSEQLMNKEMQMQKQLSDSISVILEKYNSDKNFHFIFGFAQGSNLLYAIPQLDITEDILEVVKAK